MATPKTKGIKHISSSEYINRFVNTYSTVQFKNAMVQVYDYQDHSKFLKTPTTLFRPDYNYVIYLKSGFIKKQLGTEMNYIEAPAVVFVGAGHVVGMNEVSADPEGTIVVFENDILNEILSRQDLLKLFDINPIIKLSQKTSTYIGALSDLLLQEYQENKMDMQIITPLLQAMFQKLLNLSDRHFVLSQSHLIALRFKELVYRNFVQEKSVSYYAREMAITENYLNRCSNQILNKSAKKFIIEVTILQSRILLQDMGKHVTEIANELNFEDPAYFTRIFKKVTGISPSDYKKQILTNL
jgi:AraC family transcriptional activator of pobA